MQKNVNAENVWSSLNAKFGSENVTRVPGDDEPIRLTVNELGNGDILNISNLLIYADILIKRSDKSILILFSPKGY